MRGISGLLKFDVRDLGEDIWTLPFVDGLRLLAARVRLGHFSS